MKIKYIRIFLGTNCNSHAVQRINTLVNQFFKSTLEKLLSEVHCEKPCSGGWSTRPVPGERPSSSRTRRNPAYQVTLNRLPNLNQYM